MTVLRTLTYWFKRETERERERGGGEVGGREGERERERESRQSCGYIIWPGAAQKVRRAIRLTM